MFRSPSLLARFGIVSALLLAIAGLALAQILTSVIESRAREQAEYIAVVAIRMGVAPRFEPADFTSGRTQQRDQQFLDREMAASLAEEDHYQPLRLKVYNAERMVIYSDKDELIGDTHDSANLRAAIGGELVSKTSLLNDLDEVEGKEFDPEAFEVYVPLTYGGDEVVGVAELYLPYAPIERAIAEDTRTLYAALAAALLLFYVLMFRMVARASRRLLQQASELRSGAKRHEHLANHDLLTQLPNRALLIDRLERAVIEARRHGNDVAVLLLDLDRFKEVNDTLGHETGDALLCLVGERIGRELRAMDTVARVGGDEFVVLLPHVVSRAAAMLVAERVLDALHRPFYVDGIELAVEASIGIACFPEHGEDQGSLLKHADVAMYVAKEARGTFAVYDAQSDTSSLSRTTLLTELRRALDEHELVLYYQPTSRLSDGAVCSVEALVRWNHPTRGLVPPDDFIPIAEQTGLISPLTTYVLSEALRQLRVWLDEGRDLSVAVNLSARNLMDPRLPELVAALLAAAGVEPGRLEVEVTETSAMADPTRAAAVLRGLSDLGVTVAVDDYGTGYSSLSYLRSLPISTLKIDRSFVTRMLQDEGSAVIVRSTIELAQNLGLRVVAEGVEDAATYAELARLDCHIAQGYFISRPVPPELLAPMLDERNVAAPPRTAAQPV